MTTRNHPLTVGSILSASWGYDQTNVDYYKVVELRGKTLVKIVPIGSRLVRTTGAADYVVPDPDHVRDWDVLLGEGAKDGKWKRPNKYGSVALSHTRASLDSGRERYETNAMYGH